jgi:twinkle protein
MSVVTGHPGHGKTALWAQIWFSIVRKYGVGACMATFETRPVPHMRRTLRTLFWGKLECDMSTEEKARADYWIDDRYRWIIHPDQKPTLGWLLDMAEVAVIRHGARIVQIDPWNRLESQRGQNETETDYIGRCLTSLYVFAQQMNVHVQVLAHPSKMDGPRKGKAPELDDIAGSKHWDNRVDQGFVVHRPKLFEGGQRCTDAELLYKKSRFEELGYPCKLLMRFDTARRTYVSVDYEA